jgi:hypothetical protein
MPIVCFRRLCFRRLSFRLLYLPGASMTNAHRLVLFLNLRARCKLSCKHRADSSRGYLADAVCPVAFEMHFRVTTYRQPKDSINLSATGPPKITIRISERTEPLLTSQCGMADGNPACRHGQARDHVWWASARSKCTCRLRVIAAFVQYCRGWNEDMKFCASIVLSAY